MSNSLTPAIPSLIGAFQSVLREQVGFIRAVNADFDDKGAGLNQTFTIPTAPALAAAVSTPAATVASGTDVTAGSLTHNLDTFKHVKFHLTQEEVVSLRENREGFKSAMLEQAMRTLVNTIETDCATACLAASRATGTAGTTPFGSNHNVLADLGLILNNNAAFGERHFVMDFAAQNKLSKLAVLLDASAYGDSSMVRDGMIGKLDGFNLHTSAQVDTARAVGTGTSYVIDNGNIAVGSTTISIDGGSGTILAGDIIEIGADGENYVVTTGVAAAGNIVIAKPGLRIAIVDADAVAIKAASTRNMGFTRDAIALTVRPPKRDIADQATEVILISDPLSGLTFELAYYPQFLQGTWFLSAVWGVTNVHPEKTALLLG